MRLALMNDNWTAAISKGVPNRAPIRPALSLALEFEPLAPHSSSAFRAYAIQDIRNNFRIRVKATHRHRRHTSLTGRN